MANQSALNKYFNEVLLDMDEWKSESEDYLWQNIHAKQAQHLLSQKTHNAHKWLQVFNQCKTIVG